MALLSGACIGNRRGIGFDGSGGNAQGGSSAQSGGGNPLCGNTILDTAETCDDGNNAAGDGCGSDCLIEPGWNCDDALPSNCSEVCGDFLLVGSEQCDDGNIDSGDGCDGSCAFEATCGNGQIEPGEQCDDGNTVGGDGCNDSCAYESGSACGDAIDLQIAATETIEDTFIYEATTVGSPYADGTDLAAPPNTCVGPNRPSGVPMRVHRYVLQYPGILLARLDHVRGGMHDSVMWMFTDCADAPLACNDDIGGSQGNRRSHLASPQLPAGTAVYIALAAYDADGSGDYRLRVTELPRNPLLDDPPGSCAAPRDGLPGAALDGVLGPNDANALGPSCQQAVGPESVHRLSLPGPVDAFSTVVSFNPSYQPHAFSMAPSCALNNERACSPMADGITRLRDRNVGSGDYHVAVDGAAANGGHYTMVTDTITLLAIGDGCTPGNPAARCVPGAACAPNNTCVATLLDETFDSGLGSLTPSNNGDGQWTLCGDGCLFHEITGSYSLRPFIYIDDGFTEDTFNESLRSAMLSATGLSNVMVEFDHTFLASGCPMQEGRIEVSTDGNIFTSAATFDSFLSNQHAIVDISPDAGNQPQLWIQWVFDQGEQTNCDGGPWFIDDLQVYAY